MTRDVGIIGYPLGHSISAQFQQAAFDHLGLDVRYHVWETAPDGLPSLVASLRQPHKLGANVTIPYKEAVLPLLDDLDDLAREIGAVNTVVNRQGGLEGHNTDAEGFITALRQEAGFNPEGRRAVLLGAGGAARAAGVALARAGIESLAIVNRTQERAQQLAADLVKGGATVSSVRWEESQLKRVLVDCDLVVNCTSLGMKGSAAEGQSPLPPELIPGQALVYDVVYNPVETPLLAAARRAGARTLGGLSMLVYQGAASFRIWTGRKAPVDIMFEAARRALDG